jgi:hypothetical protein
LGFEDLEPIDPAFAINPKVLEKLGVSWKKLAEY